MQSNYVCAYVAQMCHISIESVSDNVWHFANHSYLLSLSEQ